MPRGQFGLALVVVQRRRRAGPAVGHRASPPLAVGWWRLSRLELYRRWVVVPVSLAIALVGLYWTATRALG